MGGTVLVLSGGGAKAAAHLGAWRALVETGARPSRIIATSMGAVVAAALARGEEPDHLLERIAAIGPRGVMKSPLAPMQGMFAASLLRPAPFRAALADFVRARSFEELAVPLTVTTTDLDTGALVAFGAGANGATPPLVDVLVAACALPFYLPPVLLGGRRLADGGLHGALPLELAADLGAERVVAVDVGPGFDPEPPAPGTRRLPSLVRAHDEATGILMAHATAVALALWRATAGRPPLIYIRPRLERAATFRVDRVREYAEVGYQATRDALRGAVRP